MNPSEYVIDFQPDGVGLSFWCGRVNGHVRSEDGWIVVSCCLDVSGFYKSHSQRVTFVPSDAFISDGARKAVEKHIFEWAKFQHLIDQLERRAVDAEREMAALKATTEAA